MLVNAVKDPKIKSSRKPKTFSDNLFTLPKEPEDARMTGGTRSLDRRLLALNLHVAQAGSDGDRY